MTIREYAKITGFPIVGKLTRHPEFERYGDERFYLDEDNNEFTKFWRGEFKGQVLIVTKDGGIWC